MKNYYLKKIQTLMRNRTFFLLGIILLVAVIIRTYHFHDLLRFNTDQARDAEIIRDAASGKTAWPLLGPKAGGTEFRLGPAFYYFGIISAKIFGLSPDGFAYPDLFFSLLSVPLLYLLMRKYFAEHVSLSLCFLYAISFFSVKYSRFSWNPNSTPFFSMLFFYSLLEIFRDGQKRQNIWAILCGIALGIGIQLHSLFLFAMPAVLFIFLIYAFRTGQLKKTMLAPLAMMIATAHIMNIPQIVSEFRTGGLNTENFINGYMRKSETDESLWEKLALDSACHLQANGFIPSSFGAEDECKFFHMTRRKFRQDRYELYAFFSLCAIFSLGGYYLLTKKIRKETVPERKNFLVLALAIAGVMFFLLLPLANEIAMRFFLPTVFIPFILLGLWLELILGKKGRYSRPIAAILIIMLALLSAVRLKKEYSSVAMDDPDVESQVDNVTLQETEDIHSYILSKIASKDQVVIAGSKADLFKLIRPLRYMFSGSEIDIQEFSKEVGISPSSTYFYIGHRKLSGEAIRLSKDTRDDFSISDQAPAGRFVIMKIDPIKK